MTDYPHANVLGEGPNVSHRRRSAIVPMLIGAAVAVLGAFVLYAWRVQP